MKNLIRHILIISFIAVFPLKADNEALIQENLRNLNSSDAAVRHRAIIVLSKFNNDPRAMPAMINALRDTSPKVREAALVSIQSMPMTQNALNDVVNCIDDPSVSVRRICSSMLRNYFPDGSPNTLFLTREVKQKISKAFTDKDDVVRRNLIARYSAFSSLLPDSTLSKLLKDKNREVRILALVAASRSSYGRQFLSKVRHLAKDEDRLIRLKLVKTMQARMYLDEKMIATLMEDKDSEISTYAELMQLSLKPDSKRWKSLYSKVNSADTKSELAIVIVKELIKSFKADKGELTKLLKHNKSAIRKAALQNMLIYKRSLIKNSDYIDFLSDSNSEIRKTAMRQVDLSKIPLEKIEAFAESPYSDIRNLVLVICNTQQVKGESELIMGLFLDDNTEVRSTALKLIYIKKLEDWQQILEDSLEDDEMAVKKMAVQLSAQNKGTQKALYKYLKDGDDEELKLFIRQYLGSSF